MIHFIHLKNYPILEQLRLEEALLRTDHRSFCIVNEGSSKAIVMGISSKADELVDLEKAKAQEIPVIRRFSGGGCVIVSHATLFVSFIFTKELLSLPPFPEPLLKWTEGFYQNALKLDNFHLRENDYVLGEKKCGGNAQYIKKDRWVHHTSFLWDYHPDDMKLLHFPKKVPSYREGRSHGDFLCTLKEAFPEMGSFSEAVKKELKTRFRVKNLSLEEAKQALSTPHRTSTIVLE
jgi:lipoate---protein ligase